VAPAFMTTTMSNLRRRNGTNATPSHTSNQKHHPTQKAPGRVLRPLSFRLRKSFRSGRGLTGRIKIPAKPKAETRERTLHLSPIYHTPAAGQPKTPTRGPIICSDITAMVLEVRTTRLRGVAQLGRAPGLGPGGRKFESCRPDCSNRVETCPVATSISESPSTTATILGVAACDRSSGGREHE
jgi:hypothetical protein